MKLKLIQFIFTLLAVAMALPSVPAYSQQLDANSKYGNGIVNSAGQWAQQVGAVGARANRNAADQLFQQALQHEAAGLASLNPGLLSQALTEARQGIKADDQARHFAQTSLEAMKSGNTAGQVDVAGKYGTTESELRDLANNSSPFLPTVQSHLDGWGIKVDHSADVVKTPFGTFPISASPQDMASIMGKIANALGYSEKGVNEGVQSGISASQAIAQKAMADAQLAASKGGRAIASVDPSSGKDAGGAKAADAKPDAAAAADAKDPKAAAKNAGALTAEQEMAKRIAALTKSREEMLKGMKVTPDAYGDRDSDLFAIVHDRYQEMRRLNSFNEYGQPGNHMTAAAAIPR